MSYPLTAHSVHIEVSSTEAVLNWYVVNLIDALNPIILVQQFHTRLLKIYTRSKHTYFMYYSSSKYK